MICLFLFQEVRYKRGCIINKIEALRIVYTKTFSTTYPNKFNKKEADHDL